MVADKYGPALILYYLRSTYIEKSSTLPKRLFARTKSIEIEMGRGGEGGGGSKPKKLKIKRLMGGSRL